MDNLGLDSDSDGLPPRPTAFSVAPRPTPSTLSLLGVKYVIKERVGRWWKGACFRPIINKTVLDDVTMTLHGGQITAIVGSSGSGKTSLLDVTSCRAEGRVTGEIYYNEHVCTREIIQRHASYVMQADRFLPNLSVRETLRYTAYLKLPGNSAKEEIEQTVQKVINEMGLRQVADSRIGGVLKRGISGGEKRRVTIALQLLKDPDILLLDEPTSGLDSCTARYLVSNLADLAHRGKIVLLTIHQPRSDIFRLFDQIAILTLGKVAYFGKGDNLVPYFTRIGYPCPIFTNPLDRYIDVASVDRRTTKSKTETMERVRHIVKTYGKSQLHRDTMQVAEESRREAAQDPYSKEKDVKGPSLARIMLTLLSRMYVNLARDRTDFLSRLLILPLFATFIIIFLGRLKHNQESIQDRTGLLYQSISVPPYTGIINAVALFPPIREIFYREGRDGLYSAGTFLISYTLHVLPFNLVSSILFSSYAYWVCGLNSDPARFGMFSAVVFTMYLCGELLTVATMGIFLSPELANNIVSLIVNACVLFATGFLRTIGNLPEPLQWLGYGTIFKYGSEILVANEYHGLNLTCDRTSKTVPCLYPDGDTFLDALYPGAVDHLERNFGLIAGFSVGFVLLAFMAFRIRGVPNLH